MATVDSSNGSDNSILSEFNQHNNLDSLISMESRTIYNKKSNNDSYLNIIQMSPSSFSLSPTKPELIQEIKSTAMKKLLKNKKQLDYITNELVITEEQYVEHLNFLKNNFLKFLINEPIFNMLDYCIKNLINIHTSLSDQLNTITNKPFNDSLVKIDTITMKISNSVSIYFYENYIKIYYIILRMMNEENTELNQVINNLNNLITLTKYEKNDNEKQEKNNFTNMSFKSLMQAPINRIMKYKIFISRILVNYVADPFYKVNIAEHLNKLLIKLEKIDDFQLDYITTVKVKKNIDTYKEYDYNIDKKKHKKKHSNNNTFDPNFKYNNIIDKIIFKNDNIKMGNFGPIILLQPVVLYYIKDETKVKSKTDSLRFISKKYAIKHDNSKFSIFYKTDCIALLFKSHLLILEPTDSNSSDLSTSTFNNNNSNGKLMIKFCIPLEITDITNKFDDGLMTTLVNTVKIIIEYNFLKYEILITCWNDIEFENFNNKLKHLRDFYNSNENSVYISKNANSYTLSIESLINSKSLQFNNINHIFKQFIKPNDIAIKDYKMDYLSNNNNNNNKDTININSYFNQVFSVKSKFINDLNYDEDNHWIWQKQKKEQNCFYSLLNNDYKSNLNDKENVVLNVDARLNIEKFITQNNLWFSSIDILRLSDYKQETFFFKSKRTVTKSGSFRNFLALATGSFKSGGNKSPEKSSTSTSDKSLLFLPSSTVLSDQTQLRANLIINSANLNGSSYYNGLEKSKTLEFISANEVKTTKNKNNDIDNVTLDLTPRPITEISSSRENEKYMTILKTLKLDNNEEEEEEKINNDNINNVYMMGRDLPREMSFVKEHAQSDDTIWNKEKITQSMEQLLLLNEEEKISDKNTETNVDALIESYKEVEEEKEKRDERLITSLVRNGSKLLQMFHQ